MNTYPGNYRYAKFHHPKDRGKSSTIPVWLPRWYAVKDSRNSSDLQYARKSISNKDKVIIFNRTKMTKIELDKSSALYLFTIGERLSDVKNHRVEDMFEILYIIRGRKLS